MYQEGLYLSKEKIDVPWKDYFGNRDRELSIHQYRFCLTAISTNLELKEHTEKFGPIGIEFEIDFAVKLGGFPVFYVPTPGVDSSDQEDFKGISLLYRIADAQEVLEALNREGVFISKDIDLHNVLGALKFLGNICYPTQRILKNESGKSNYYGQREWRLIYGLLSQKAVVSPMNDFYVLSSFDDKSILEYATKIVIGENGETQDKIYEVISKEVLSQGLKINIEKL